MYMLDEILMSRISNHPLNRTLNATLVHFINCGLSSIVCRAVKCSVNATLKAIYVPLLLCPGNCVSTQLSVS